MERRPLITPHLLTYLLPIATSAGEDLGDLPAYLSALASPEVEVLVVDGSPPSEVERHRCSCGPRVRVIPTEHRTVMGKVGNVITGLEHARYEHVVIADDDVRYTVPQLRHVRRLLDYSDVVRPQNYFSPLPWHARIDTARILLARMTGGDWPGTLGVRRSAVLGGGGYAGDVMFENLELVRTIVAAGGREHVALDLLVARRPPTTGHFARQQVRQAYDELARPARLGSSLVLLPLVALGVLRGHRVTVAAGVVVAAAIAEAGRRRAGGRDAFPASSSLLAGPWLLWRSACSWGAVGARVRGGVKYRGTRLKRAATPTRQLRSSTMTGISRVVFFWYSSKFGISFACAA